MKSKAWPWVAGVAGVIVLGALAPGIPADAPTAESVTLPADTPTRADR